MENGKIRKQKNYHLISYSQTFWNNKIKLYIKNLCFKAPTIESPLAFKHIIGLILSDTDSKPQMISINRSLLSPAKDLLVPNKGIAWSMVQLVGKEDWWGSKSCKKPDHQVLPRKQIDQLHKNTFLIQHNSSQ